MYVECTIHSTYSCVLWLGSVVVKCHTHSPEGRAVGGEDGGGFSGGEGGSSVSALSSAVFTTWDGTYTHMYQLCTASGAEMLTIQYWNMNRVSRQHTPHNIAQV